MFMRRKIRPNVFRSSKPSQNTQATPDFVTPQTLNSTSPDKRQTSSLTTLLIENDILKNHVHKSEVEELGNSTENSSTNDDKVSPTNGNINIEVPTVSVENVTSDKKIIVTPIKENITSSEESITCSKERVPPSQENTTVSKENVSLSKENGIPRNENGTSSKENVSVNEKTFSTLRKESLVSVTEGLSPRTECPPSENDGYVPTTVACIPSSDLDDETSQFTLSSPIKSSKKVKNDKEVTHPRRYYTKVKEPPERSKMTMMDLIYYNPSENPMKTPSVKVQPKDQKIKNEMTSKKKETEKTLANDELDSLQPAPRVKIDEDGQIILDEESLVIEHTVPDSYSVVTEDSETNYFSFRDRLVSRKWPTRESAIFYKALTVIGTDFALMSELLRNRSRHELKLKFKREEKKNGKLIDKILSYSNANGLEELCRELDDYYNDISADESMKSDAQATNSINGKPRRKRGRPKKKARDSDSENHEPENLQSSDCISLEASNENHLVAGLTQSEDSRQVGELNHSLTFTDRNDAEVSSVTPKRGRGRPRKTPVINDNNDATSAIEDKVPKVQKRRGRKPKNVNVDVDTVEISGSENPVTLDVDMVPPTSTEAVVLDPSQKIVLVSETGEEIPFEVVFEHPSENFGKQAVELISCVESDEFNADTPAYGDSSVLITESENNVRVENQINVFKDSVSRTSRYKKRVEVKRLMVGDSAKQNEMDELENVKNAVHSILTDESSTVLPLVEDSPEIAAYVTLENTKVGRKRMRSTVFEDSSVVPKRNKAKYSDFTVMEFDVK